MAPNKILLASSFLFYATCASGQGTRPFSLMVGDPAPPLSVSKWLKGEPLQYFKSGHVYVLEFWATWCRPCVDAIPHLTELQRKHEDKVQFIGVDVWERDQALVPAFVTKMGEKMDYAVAMDSVPQGDERGLEGAMAKDWLAAAGQDSIPCTFIVDKAGKIAWIGHPLEVDEPLAKVIDGTWNAESHLKESLPRLQTIAKERALERRFRNALEARRADEAIQVADEAIVAKIKWAYGWKAHALAELKKDLPAAAKVYDEMMAQDSMVVEGGLAKLDLYLWAKDFHLANATARELVDGPFRDNAQGLGQVVVALCHPDIDPKQVDLGLTLRAAQRAVELDRTAFHLRALSLVHFVRSEKAEAIAAIKAAIPLANDSYKEHLEKVLKQYESVK